MAAEYGQTDFQLAACHELLDAHPGSLRTREQVEALEDKFYTSPDGSRMGWGLKCFP